MSKQNAIILIFAAIISLIVFTSCQGPAPVKTNQTRAEPRLLIVSPGDNDYFGAKEEIKMNLGITDFNFSEGFVSVKIDDSTIINTTEKELNLGKQKPGKHMILVSLMHNDGSPYGIQQGVAINVKAAIPNIKIVSPKDQDKIINESQVTVQLSTNDFGEEAGNPGEIAITLDNATIYTSKTEYAINLTSGMHTIKAELVKPDRSSYNASDTISFTAEIPRQLANEASPPDFEVWYPKNGTNIKGDRLSLSLKLFNFTIGNINDTNQDGYGYFKVYIDNATEPISIDTASYTISGLSAGNHTMRVEMVQNDGTPYYVNKIVAFQAQTVTGVEVTV